ncbi:hypothetical protein ACIPPN_21185 [Streptomyces diastaticus]|uniref:hypothetical protein n=1 Tax=Streptomyces diastaticus TaxID=1956 RepID=UPI00368F3D69
MIQHVRRKIARALSAMPETSIPISHAVQTAVASILLLRLSLRGAVVSTLAFISLFSPSAAAAGFVLAVSLALAGDHSGLAFLKIRRFS